MRGVPVPASLLPCGFFMHVPKLSLLSTHGEICSELGRIFARPAIAEIYGGRGTKKSFLLASLIRANPELLSVCILTKGALPADVSSLVHYATDVEGFMCVVNSLVEGFPEAPFHFLGVDTLSTLLYAEEVEGREEAVRQALGQLVSLGVRILLINSTISKPAPSSICPEHSFLSKKENKRFTLYPHTHPHLYYLHPHTLTYI
ncbi:hypothetical protein NECID01_1569 [Nematocida sp. AWRm77]|nr:hypothetical protein NECID01_1569 [Nematocida sp. AWRm77]